MNCHSLTIVLPLIGLILSTVSCRRETTNSESEEEVTRPQFGIVRVSTEAQQGLGLETFQVTQRTVASTLTTTGWLKAKPGNEVLIKAAATGFVIPTGDTKIVQLGSTVGDGQELGKLHIFLSPQEEAQLVSLKEDADTVIEQSLASLAIAEDRYNKVKSLDGIALAGNDLQALREAVERSKAAVQEARDKLPFLPPEPYERPLRLGDVVINAPIAGHLTDVFIRPRQLVVQGDSLWTIADWSTLWLSVPVFEGDIPFVDQTKKVKVVVPGSVAALHATPTGIPQRTEDGRRTVDLLYEIANADGLLRPGQPVSVEMPTGKTSEQLVIPQSALLWDGMGNAWVYVREGADTFRRQRVQIGSIQDEGVVVERGLKEADEVIVAGAETLYGEEFKSQFQVEDDD